MRSNLTKLALLGWIIGISDVVCQAQAPLRLQKSGIKQSDQDKQRAEEVKTTFIGAFDDYIKFGFPADEVKPLSKTGRNTRNGWSATLVDSLDTLFVMDLQERFAQGVADTLKIDFSKSQTEEGVSIFETTIRYIAGILSAYELSGATNAPLLDQARKLADKLLLCWQDDQQNLPFPFLDFTTNKPVVRDYISAASAGSLIMEFDRLSFYTRQPKYLAYATKAVQTVIKTPSPLPGLPGLTFGVKNQTILSNYATWGSGTDSYLEYLLKYGMLINNSDNSYYKTWKQAVQSSIQKLIQVSPVRNLTYLGGYSTSSNTPDYEFSHLACFTGGNWLMGGKVFQDDQLIDYGLKLIATCMETYKRTATGLGPEIFRFLGPKGETTDEKPSPQDLEFFRANGFYIANAAYHLRPEVIESVFYAWRLTGDTQYQEFVWQAFKSLQKYCKAPASYSDIEDVNSSSNPKPKDASESFLYAETFKYIYLTFSDPELLSLDQYVFNTEAHPFRYQGSQNSTSNSTSTITTTSKKTGAKLGSASAQVGRVSLGLLLLCPLLTFFWLM
ncbi:maturation of Asn-linked oligosaccharides protein [Puccinia graminis f. sp. tritici]|uniref:alpha-1,2-Mannosidase n=1 Tax=Puccinia graminis f. sp. tritici TaxID=56615 RepID=A0A5B0NST4_PUCGR|nr:maturation of Asn-linked oligosaccharides protein [Puccinia graminis f. sp. tritici]